MRGPFLRRLQRTRKISPSHPQDPPINEVGECRGNSEGVRSWVRIGSGFLPTAFCLQPLIVSGDQRGGP
jgi:hypothetical protein